MIEYVTGDFFDYPADIRINTVNCVGVMGAGVALEFKNRYPQMFKEYVRVCKSKDISPEKPYVWEEYDLFSRCIIVNLPTKIHWRDPSEYTYIEANLQWLRDFLKDKSEDVVVTLPALGCGHGGLDWGIVKEQIKYFLGDLKPRILVFDPVSSNAKYKDVHYGLRKTDGNVKIIHKGESLYPTIKSSINEVYCKGNIEILSLKRLSILCGNEIKEKEINAIMTTIKEIVCLDYAIVLGLNNKKHLELAKLLLSNGSKLILVIPYGITKFNQYAELADYSDRFVILSYVTPNQECKRYEYINSFKHRSEMADVILYTSEDINNIKRDVKYLQKYKCVFYINYWYERIYEFYSINAKKIVIDPRTMKPNTNAIQACLNGRP